jgi:DnaK suppressor protein
MTPAQRDQLKETLLALQRSLTEEGPAKIEPNRTSDNEVGDNEDEQPLNEMMQAIASSRNRTRDNMLGRVSRALARLRDEPDEFGVCEECGEEIAYGRLKAMPFAECCVECQALRDGPRGGGSRRKLTDYR